MKINYFENSGGSGNKFTVTEVTTSDGLSFTDNDTTYIRQSSIMAKRIKFDNGLVYMSVWATIIPQSEKLYDGGTQSQYITFWDVEKDNNLNILLGEDWSNYDTPFYGLNHFIGNMELYSTIGDVPYIFPVELYQDNTYQFRIRFISKEDINKYNTWIDKQMIRMGFVDFKFWMYHK